MILEPGSNIQLPSIIQEEIKLPVPHCFPSAIYLDNIEKFSPTISILQMSILTVRYVFRSHINYKYD